MTHVSRLSDTELAVTHTCNAPAALVFQAWTTAEIFKRWWVPRSMGAVLYAVEMDVRPGGTYRVQFAHNGGPGMTFFGTYKEVQANSRLVWTNEESAEGAITTVTFEAKSDQTMITLRELYPNKSAFDLSYDGTAGGMPEQLSQLDQILEVLKAR